MFCKVTFALFDTPRHIAELTNISEKQDFAIDLTGLDQEACLCEKCYRFVERNATSRSDEVQTNLERVVVEEWSEELQEISRNKTQVIMTHLIC